MLCFTLAICGVLIGGSQTVNAATFTVTNTNNTGAGSLVQAILDANAAPDHDTIAFSIPGAGPHVIAPTLLTGLTNPATIDGCTQPGSDCSKFPLDLKIQISAANMTSSANQGVISVNNVGSSGSLVRGLSLTGGTAKLRAGIRLFGPLGNVTIQSNLIGIAPDGTVSGNTIGIRTDIFTQHSATNTYDNIKIGGNLSGQGNVISGSSTFGISFPGSVANARPMEGLLIQGNYIGLDPTGTQPRPNTTAGINLTIMDGAQIGGTTAGASNTIAYNGTGIALGGQLNDTLVQGNKIRSNTTGISFVNATDATVGGIASGQSNEISGNTGKGVVIGANTSDTSSGIIVSGNSIFGNSVLGVDLANDGITANGAAGVVRTGPNSLVNFPVLTSFTHGSAIIQGTYSGAPNETYTLDFYSNSSAGPSGSGQGQTLLGSGQVTTDSSGNAMFNFTFNVNVPAGYYVSATATDSLGNTSEFSGDLVVPPVASLSETGQNTSLYIMLASSLIAVSFGLILRDKFTARVKGQSGN